MPTIDYQLVVPYRLLPVGFRPCLAVRVTGPRDYVDLVAHVDSGSYHVVFDGQTAKAIGLNLTDGEYKGLQSSRGVIHARLHDVTLEVEGYRFPCRVAFTEEHIVRPLLGRTGFFDLWQIGFRERVSEMYLSPDPHAPELTPPGVT